MNTQCVVLEQAYNIKIETRDVPERKRGEVLLATQYGGICGGDIAQYRGNFFQLVYPLIQGHEFSAKVIEADANNKYGLKEGMLVTGLPYFGCGVCLVCKNGIPQCCVENKTFGGFRDGAFRQYFTFPDWRVYDCTGIEAQAAALIEPFVIGHHAVQRPGLHEDDKILVIGAGTIGLVTAIMAKHYGGDVTICDVVQSKLDVAKNVFGIPSVILNDDPLSFIEKTKENTNGYGYNVVFEAVGLPDTFLDALEVAMIGGKVVQIGVGKKSVDLDFNIIQKKHLDILGTRNGLEDDFRKTIELVREGSLGDISKLITAVYSYTEAVKAYEYVDKHNDQVLKCLIEFAK